MQKSNIEVSIVIVNYNVKEELFECLRSIYVSKPRIAFEIIVVDNDEIKTIEKDLKKKFPKVRYIKNSINSGWGGGTNIGVRNAFGKYIYFLNPDTIVLKNALDNIYSFIRKNRFIGIASSIILDKNKKPNKVQGTQDLTPFNGIFVFSLISKLFPKNNVNNSFYSKDWDRRKSKQIDVPPLCAAIIRKELFIKVGGFDEKYFLYFEEYDLAKRINSLGCLNYRVPSSKVIHYWAGSTKNSTGISKIFEKSRFYYFRKYYGVLPAILVHMIVTINKYTVLFWGVLLLSLFLTCNKISTHMIFIGDQGWFYLSARDIFLKGDIPLVGIPSSHPWLNQGPLWTYLLSPVLLFSGFNPLSGGILSIFIHLLTVFYMYLLGSIMFSKRVALIGSFLYATSPLIVIHARMPYHTTPIPFLVLILLYFSIQWIRKQEVSYIPLIILMLSLLYNFEIVTFVLAVPITVLAIYGYLKKKKWAIINRKITFWSFVSFLIPMFPVILFDFQNKFPHLIKFPIWLLYRVGVLLGLLQGKGESNSYGDMIQYFYKYNQKFMFLAQSQIALFLTLFLMSVFIWIIFKNFRKEKQLNEYIVLSFFLVITFSTVLINKTPSEAYLPMVFPLVTFLLAISFNDLLKMNKVIVSILILSIGFMNTYFLITNNYLMTKRDGYGIPLQTRIEISKIIVDQSGNQPYSLVGKGPGSQFSSFLDNYDYLTWWLGKGASQNREKTQFIITENENTVNLHIKD